MSEPTDATQPVTQAVREHFPGAPIRSDDDGVEFEILIPFGRDEDQRDQRIEIVADALYEVGVQILDYDTVGGGFGSGLQVRIHAMTNDEIEARDAEAESRAIAEAEARAERALDRGRW